MEKRVVLHDLRVMSTALHLVCFSMSESQREYKKSELRHTLKISNMPTTTDHKLGWMTVDAAAATSCDWEHALF